MSKDHRKAVMFFDKSPDKKKSKEILSLIAGQKAEFTPRQIDKPIALYGAGNLGKMASEYFRHFNIHVECVIDANAEKCQKDPFWENVNIYSPANTPKKIRKSALLTVCVAQVPYSELSSTLAKTGWEDIVPFYDIAESYRDRHPLSNGWFSGTLERKDIKNIEFVLENWADDISRAHHLQFIAWHRLREDWIFQDADVTLKNRYLIPEVTAELNKNERFLDIGAHHGNAIKAFLETVDSKFEKIWAIEPDRKNLQELTNNLHSIYNKNDNISVLPYAVSDKISFQPFFGKLGYASQISELGHESIETTTIDHLKLDPTFIKIHIEGRELEALIGSLETIKRHRPIITTTSYHDRSGLWEIPEWMIRHLQNYRFHMRLHGWCATVGVVYAIPINQ